jgi:hypothetical protein
MEAYEACLAATSTEHAPWYVVPADDKKNARLIVSHIIIETMKGFDISTRKSVRRAARNYRRSAKGSEGRIRETRAVTSS